MSGCAEGVARPCACNYVSARRIVAGALFEEREGVHTTHTRLCPPAASSHVSSRRLHDVESAILAHCPLTTEVNVELEVAAARTRTRARGVACDSDMDSELGAAVESTEVALHARDVSDPLAPSQAQEPSE